MHRRVSLSESRCQELRFEAKGQRGIGYYAVQNDGEDPRVIDRPTDRLTTDDQPTDRLTALLGDIDFRTHAAVEVKSSKSRSVVPPSVVCPYVLVFLNRRRRAVLDESDDGRPPTSLTDAGGRRQKVGRRTFGGPGLLGGGRRPSITSSRDTWCLAMVVDDGWVNSAVVDLRGGGIGRYTFSWPITVWRLRLSDIPSVLTAVSRGLLWSAGCGRCARLRSSSRVDLVLVSSVAAVVGQRSVVLG
ncbi:unnamed protein product [Soboliphyme baturini]|uniref:DUF4365 domain-containing protein n=1 Tax=Soboliphyme baturini TaxID=241478 RepID=A0A183IVS5_9BILA|nr:unnamed protein product [Soboliphyme baturini]